MSPEQKRSSISVEHWDYKMAREAGHQEMAVMGMFTDVAVVREGEEIVGVKNVRELKIEWERFKRNEDYAGEVLREVEKLIKRQDKTDKVMEVFSFYKKDRLKFGETEERAARKALHQTLYVAGLNDAGITLSDLDMETSRTIASALIKVSDPHLREILKEFEKGEYGDTLLTVNFDHPRAKRILVAARRLYREGVKTPKSG